MQGSIPMKKQEYLQCSRNKRAQCSHWGITLAVACFAWACTNHHPSAAMDEAPTTTRAPLTALHHITIPSEAASSPIRSDLRGDIAVVGVKAGAHVYRRSGAIWAQEQLIPPPTQGEFPTSIAVDGSTLLIGQLSAAAQGSVHVLTHDGSAWSLQTTLEHPQAASGDHFGRSVAIFGDVAVVGAGAAILNQGTPEAHVFERANGTWSHTATLTTTDAKGNFGAAVSVHEDTIAVGDGTSESAGVFVRGGGTWIEQATLTTTDADSASFGNSLSVWKDEIVIGARFGRPGGRGTAYVFRRNGTNWTLSQVLAPESSVQFGQSVSLRGNRLAVGAPLSGTSTSPDGGNVYLFERTADQWTTAAVLEPPDSGSLTKFGWGVAVDDSALLALHAGRVHAELFTLEGSCSDGSQCASGFCVDGVCCETACGGGITTDCQVCSVASGGAQDGVCGTLQCAAGECLAGLCTQTDSGGPPDGSAGGPAQDSGGPEPNGPAPSDDSSCSCEVPRNSSTPLGTWLVMTVFPMVFWFRRSGR